MMEVKELLKIEFEESNHTYKVEGIPAPSITTILDSELPLTLPKDHENMVHARIIGDEAHKATWFYDQNDLDEKSLYASCEFPDEVAGCLEAWKKCKAKYQIEILMVERAVGCLYPLFAGRPDRLVNWKLSPLTILEIKTGMPLKRNQLQTMGQKMGFLKTFRIKVLMRAVVYLFPNGTYTLDVHKNETEDLLAWTSAVTLYGWKFKRGLLVR